MDGNENIKDGLNSGPDEERDRVGDRVTDLLFVSSLQTTNLTGYRYYRDRNKD